MTSSECSDVAYITTICSPWSPCPCSRVPGPALLIAQGGKRGWSFARSATPARCPVASPVELSATGHGSLVPAPLSLSRAAWNPTFCARTARSKDIPGTFRSEVLRSKKTGLPPVQNIDRVTFMHTRYNDVFFVAVCRQALCGPRAPGPPPAAPAPPLSNVS